MKDKKKVSQAVIVILAIVIIILAIYFGMNKANEYQRIKETNVKMYNHLACVSDCNIIYNLNVATKKEISEFDEECLYNCSEEMGELKFKPGELEGGKLIFESSDYNSCLIALELKGNEAYKSCLIEILPTLREKYPEVSKL